jgi:hypothetical protein
VTGGTVPWTIVHATQFHEYLAAMIGAAMPGSRAAGCADEQAKPRAVHGFDDDQE